MYSKAIYCIYRLVCGLRSAMIGLYRSCMSIALYVVHKVSPYCDHRPIALPKVAEFRIIKRLKQVYRDSYRTNGQSLPDKLRFC